MTTEQKAKAYDKAIEIAKDMINRLEKGENILLKADLKLMFPQLKESEDEDERIRKELINTINLAYDCGIAITKENRDKYLAWLEKQGERKSSEIVGSYPATKEQRELLFQKMKDAGHEWDADKKELKKIEQKTAWSEEDERMLDYALDMVEWYSGKNEDKSRLVSDWLKSLKDRYIWELLNN